MKHLRLIPIFAPLVIAACVPLDAPTCGMPNEPVVISYTKEGFPIIIEPPLSVPCVEITPSDAQTPTETLTTASTPPTHVKSNAGRGNGSELDANGNDRDPGRSGGHNKGGD